MNTKSLVLSNNPDHLHKVGGRAEGDTGSIVDDEVISQSVFHGAMEGAPHIPGVDFDRLRKHKVDALVKEMVARDFDAILLNDPLNARYALDVTNQTVANFQLYRRCVLLTADGSLTLFDWTDAPYLAEGILDASNISDMPSFDYLYCGSVEAMEKNAATFCDAVIARMPAGSKRLAADRLDSVGLAVFQAKGFEQVFDGQAVTEHARSVKSEDEIEIMKHVINVSQEGMRMMNDATDAITPDGMTENELWAILQSHNVANGGEWIETRLLAAGHRTNPWFQEASGNRIYPGDMVSFDTDLVGPYGYCSDVSRAWVAGNVVNASQKQLYQFAVDQVLDNMSRVKAGASYEDLAQASWDVNVVPKRFFPNRYSCPYHGVGLCDEYPSIPYGGEDWDGYGYEGELKENMVISVESYIGEVGGEEGVKVEEMVRVTKDGYEQLSNYPWDATLYPEMAQDG